MGTVTSKWKSQKNSRMIKIYDVATTMAVVIRMRNVDSKEVAVNVKAVLTKCPQKAG